MSHKYSLEQIRIFWTEQARVHGQGAAASWSDFRVMEMEVREIVKRLSDGDRVLDVGCANGFSTAQFASQRDVNVRGVDYIPEMIEQARQRLQEIGHRLRGGVEFAQGDITALANDGAVICNGQEFRALEPLFLHLTGERYADLKWL